VVSGKIEYAPEFLPTFGELEAGNFTYMEAFLTSRMTYGAFTQDTAPFRGVISWKYCAKKRELRQLEVIAPRQDYSSSLVAFAQANICN
jgi:hypothetical protein